MCRPMSLQTIPRLGRWPSPSPGHRCAVRFDADVCPEVMAALHPPKRTQPYIAFLLTLSETHLASSGLMIPHQATSSGFFKDRLSVDILPGVHSHTPRAMCFGMPLPRDTHVPPSWALTTLTASSTRPFVGLLHPTADHEVHRVSAAALPRRLAFPPMPYPSELSPRQVAVPYVTAGRCPLAVAR